MRYGYVKLLADSVFSTNLKLSKTTISTTDNFSVSVTVHNTGKLDGKEVVQVYLTDLISSAVTPNQHLAGFQKVLIKYVSQPPFIALADLRSEPDLRPRSL